MSWLFEWMVRRIEVKRGLLERVRREWKILYTIRERDRAVQ